MRQLPQDFRQRRLRRASRGFCICLVALGASVAGAAVADSESETIQIVESWEEKGWKLELYRNLLRSCARSGHHTFLVASRPDSEPREAHPLWMRFHGGGVGWFHEDGAFATGEQQIWKLDEEKSQLTQLLDETGLMRLISEHSAGFRLMMPSGCDNDLYSGVGTPDVHNPIESEDGRPRLVDGLLAVREALAFTRQHYATTHVFAQGTSAGGIGVTSLAISLGEEGRRLSGVVPDTGTISSYFVALGDVGCTEFGERDLRGAFARVGRYATPAFMPEERIRLGAVTTPIFEVWSRNEHSVCGEEVHTVRTDDGETLTGQGQWIMHHRLSEAIAEHDPGGASVSHKICVDRPEGLSKHREFKECALHGVTKFDVSIVGGDRDRDGEDFNRRIFDWVVARLADPVPE